MVSSAALVGLLLHFLQDVEVLLQRLVLVVLQERRRQRVGETQGPHRIGGDGPLGPALVYHDADDLDVVRRIEFADAPVSESAICGIALGETNDTASMCLNPAAISALRYSTLTGVGICPGSPCQASRGHSMSLMESAISN